MKAENRKVNHIDEKILELYVLRAPEVKEQRAQIARHLRKCPSCEELRRDISAYYEEVEQLQSEVADANKNALVVRDRIVKISPFLDRPPARAGARAIAVRAVEYVFRHPVISSLSFVGILAAALLLLYPREVAKDLNPAYARAIEEYLVVYNQSGEELWKKHIGPGFDFEKRDADRVPRLENMLATVDVDGDGTNEVLVIFGWIQGMYEPRGSPLQKRMICYHQEGKERWRYEFHRNISFGKHRISDEHEFKWMAVGDYDHDGKKEIIAHPGHYLWYPNAVVKLDAKTGSLLGEYWHPGFLYAPFHVDIDGDGVEELVLAGENNLYQKGTLVVLDPRTIRGYAPMPERSVPVGVDEGLEKYYILFGIPDLGFVPLASRFGKARITSVGSDGTTDVMVWEKSIGDATEYPIYHGLHYSFASSMEFKSVRGGDAMRSIFHQLEAQGKIAQSLEEFYEGLRTGVEYWDGEKFVREPTMNRRYLEALRKLP